MGKVLLLLNGLERAAEPGFVEPDTNGLVSTAGSGDQVPCLERCHSNAYLAHKQNQLVLTLEHRAAKAPDPITLKLVSTPQGEHTHLEVRSEISPDPSTTLSERALLVLHNASKPLSRKCLRDTLKVNNQRLGNALEALEKHELVVHTPRGWVPVRSTGQVLQEEGFG